ncbi:uncharacterized protein BXZ73DRAFT_101067 [Epithele typhae]|uniref:uncharacterized protein n=1 Tax=Epithele typhae TaxID=378194 RepID=UPI0020088AB4|nr:uncharacterized protein BXZ73DRAFT_101067 [Epithele typhae]KAH9933680.1 hypothetical protein BXZ73DRAFT_101067 [Epithele typhae]
MVQLNHDVVSYIIENLNTSDLAAMALVHSTMCSITTPLIFSIINLGIRNPTPQALEKRVQFLLTPHPRLKEVPAASIKILHTSRNSSKLATAGLLQLLRECSQLHELHILDLFQYAPVFPQILTSIHAPSLLTMLALSSVTPDALHTFKPFLPRFSALIFLSITFKKKSIPNDISLQSFKYIHCFIGTLADLPRLSRLELTGDVHTSDEGDLEIDEDEIAALPSLRSLSFVHHLTLNEWLFPFLPPCPNLIHLSAHCQNNTQVLAVHPWPHLQKFTYSCDKDAEGVIADFYNSSGITTIHHIQFEGYHYFPTQENYQGNLPPYHLLNFEHTPSLVVVSFSKMIWAQDIDGPTDCYLERAEQRRIRSLEIHNLQPEKVATMLASTDSFANLLVTVPKNLSNISLLYLRRIPTLRVINVKFLNQFPEDGLRWNRWWWVQRNNEIVKLVDIWREDGLEVAEMIKSQDFGEERLNGFLTPSRTYIS